MLRAAGVTEATILADFSRSNYAIEPLRRHVRSTWRNADGSSVEPSNALLGVTEEYYRHGLAATNELYGSFDKYLNAVGIDEAAITRLQKALLED